MMKNTHKFLLLALGHIFVVLGFIGALLPIIPTTPFLIVAAFCYSKASPRLHQKLLDLPKIGPVIKDWETHKVIRPMAKLGASFILILCFGMTIYFKRDNQLVLYLMLPTGFLILSFILSRKSKIDSL